jgi:hypothetical protein
MAVTRVNGGAAPVVTTGRDLNMYTIGETGVHTGYAAIDSDFEKLMTALATCATLEVIGTPASDAVRVAVSGCAEDAAALQVILRAYHTDISSCTVADYTF